jgi:pilus assembly protein Flp/PilA
MILDFLRLEDGVSAIEYAIIASVVALVLATAAPALGAKVRGLYAAVATKRSGQCPSGKEML